MPALDSNQLTTLRSQQHQARFYLSVSQPAELLTALVSGSPAWGATSIDYTSGTGSGFARLSAGQTLLVETATGTRAVRVRNVSGDQAAGTLTVAANNIVWANGQALTVLEEYRLWPTINRIYPKDQNGIFYKDYFEEYSDENSSPLPVCLAGPHLAGFLANGAWSFTVDLSNSYAVAPNASIAATSLITHPEDGLAITDNGDNTYTVQATVAGQYWLEASATDSNGKTQITYRRVFVHDDDNMPYTDVDISSLSGSWQQDGWSLKASIHSDAGLEHVRDHALVVLWFVANEYIGGPAGGENILFAGYIHAESIEHDYDQGSVKFGASMVEQWLNRLAINDISLAAVRTPSAWYEYDLYMTTALAVLHLIKWHSTTLEIADVVGMTGDEIQRKYAEIAASTIGGMAGRLAEQRQAKLVSNRAGQLYWQPDLLMLGDADRLLVPAVFSITTADAVGERVIRASYPQIASANVKGLAFDGAAVSAYCAIAPGVIDVFEPGRSLTTLNSVCLANQTHANVLAGRLMAQGNNPYPEVSMSFDGGYAQLFDLAPAEWFEMDVLANETPRRLVWNSKKMLPRSISLRINPGGGTMDVEINFETEAEGPDGVAANCETGYLIPAPPMPAWENVANHNGSGTLPLRAIVAFSDMGSGCYYKDDNDADWTAKNGALSGDEIEDTFGLVDPWWWTPQKSNSINPADAVMIKASAGGRLFRSVNAGDEWVDITPVTAPPNTLSDSPAPTVADLTFTCLAANYFINSALYAIAEYKNAADEWRGWLLVSANDGLSWEYYDIHAGATATRPLWLAVDGGLGILLWLTVWRDDNLYLQRWYLDTMTYVEVDLGAASQAEMEGNTYTAGVFAPIGNVDQAFVYGRIDSPAGLSGVYHVIKSDDGGATWGSVENGWGSDRCLAFYAGPDDGLGYREYYAVRGQ